MSEPIARGPGPDEAAAESCADCGAELDTVAERGFAAGSEAALCFHCAVNRGGRWDEAQQRWSVEPDISDLGAAYD